MTEENQTTKKIVANIIVDTREPKKLRQMIADHPDLIPDEQNLEKVADYILGPYLIERKAAADFFASMVNGTLFDQLLNMKHLEHEDPSLKSVLLVEGSFYPVFRRSKFRFNQKLANALLTAVGLDFGIPIVFTGSLKETVEFFVKRVEKFQDAEKTYYAVRQKSLRNKSQEYRAQFIIEGFTGVGPATAVKLLKKYETLRLALLDLCEGDGNPQVGILTNSQWLKIHETLNHYLNFK